MSENTPKIFRFMDSYVIIFEEGWPEMGFNIFLTRCPTGTANNINKFLESSISKKKGVCVEMPIVLSHLEQRSSC